MKKIILNLVTVSLLFLVACNSSEKPLILATCTDGIQNGDETGIDCGGSSCKACIGTVDVKGSINKNTTWTSNNIYILDGKVVVEDEITLNIEPGTIIKGREGVESLASALIIARGGKINAVGTAEKPIIFTSVKDNIEVNQFSGNNLTIADNGLWGGLIILGKAKGSFSGDVTEIQIEGIPATDTFGLYGGDDDDDNSGILQYVSIRHGGALIGEGNEINGLTLGTVGRGTVIDHIEIVANLDDGIEFFGGTVNPSNLLVWAQEDDGLDIDQAYAGTITNSFVILGENSDHGLEIDGPEGSYAAQFTLNNITLKGNLNTSNGEYADYRSHAMGTSNNIYAYGFKDTSDIELDNDAVATNYNDGLLTFGIWQIVLPNGIIDVKGLFKNKAETVIVEGFGNNATSVTEGNQTVGANLNEFNWTYANAQSAY